MYLIGTWCSTVVPKDIAHGRIKVEIIENKAFVNLEYLGNYKHGMIIKEKLLFEGNSAKNDQISVEFKNIDESEVSGKYIINQNGISDEGTITLVKNKISSNQ